jgi:hypothetical protein
LTPTSPPDGAGRRSPAGGRLTGRPHIERGPDPEGNSRLPGPSTAVTLNPPAATAPAPHPHELKQIPVNRVTTDFQAIRKAADEYGRATQGNRTIRREMLTRDRNDPSCYFNLVFFDSYESAMKNSTLGLWGIFSSWPGR